MISLSPSLRSDVYSPLHSTTCKQWPSLFYGQTTSKTFCTSNPNHLSKLEADVALEMNQECPDLEDSRLIQSKKQLYQCPPNGFVLVLEWSKMAGFTVFQFFNILNFKFLLVTTDCNVWLHANLYLAIYILIILGKILKLFVVKVYQH